MSDLTGLINRVVSPSPGWSASSILPLQQRQGAAPAPVMGTDEAGRTQAFVQPRTALGVPGMISAPIQSLATSAGKLDQGQVPGVKDYMPAVLALDPEVAGILRRQGVDTASVRMHPNITPASIAQEHALDMATNDKAGVEAGLAYAPSPTVAKALAAAKP